ncbi:catalase family protein [Asticcacaulis sp. YBE204]|uniref:catalase family protein n=1 Tax=Asticcacaulis sp. YBE204 TaxID=1282363 RepID=UPI0003C3C6AB|nr:catalase family protein [Asticcacaulis sp. YBE204]ESQ78719.1 hypothetical protein AEYBE204_12095 [Asticcacaulis sp. YBE204]
MSAPVPYSADLEQIEDDEAEVARDLVDTLLKISKKTHEDSGHGWRSVHAKSHALVTGKLEVPGNAPDLAQGLFAQPATYDVVLRFSTTPGDVLPDSVSTPRGLAIKVLGLDGGATQDFVMVNGPTFQAPNAKAFLANLKLLAATTDKAEGAKVAASAVLRATEGALEAMGGKSTMLRALGGEPPHHPLGETYFAQVPIRYGDYVAKFRVVPVAPELTARKGEKIDITHDPLALRKAMIAHFADQGGTWEIQVQLCTDLETMPIEKANAVWPEDESPFVTVATLVVPPQVAWSDKTSQAMDDKLSFSPWHHIEAHRPLGQIMRLRRPAYEASSRFRRSENDQPLAEPTDVSELNA